MKRYILFVCHDDYDNSGYQPLGAHDSIHDAKNFAVVTASQRVAADIHRLGVYISFRLYDKETDAFVLFRWKPAYPPPANGELQFRDPQNGRHKWERAWCGVSSCGPTDTREYRRVDDPRTAEQRIADYLVLAEQLGGECNRPWWDEETENWPGTPWSGLP